MKKNRNKQFALLLHKSALPKFLKKAIVETMKDGRFTENELIEFEHLLKEEMNYRNENKGKLEIFWNKRVENLIKMDLNT